jgi:hypothetical protein
MGGAMSSVVISGDSSGAITLAAPSVAGTNTATLPAATGTVMVSGNMPAFSAYLSANQTGISNSTWTKAQINSKEFDTASAYDNSTNYRFTPQVAGYYQVNGSILADASTTNPTYVATAVYKNGSSYKKTSGYGSITNNGQEVCCIVYLNGSTDYIELYGYMTGSISGRFDGGSIDQTYFQAALLRAA